MEYEHGCDEEVHTFDKTFRDPFLDKLSGHISDDDEEEENNGKDINARKYAFQEIEGSLTKHYAKTWSYGEEIKRTNPRSSKISFGKLYHLVISSMKSDLDIARVVDLGNVKVAFEHEVDIESDSEVEMDLDSEVESFDDEFEDGVIQEHARAQPEDDVEFEDQADDVI
ncbi:unnamed protein product [Lactuca saligna]|uniref:Uncharacterized protein n=1 Tax=Lactuca saligna TaxID=75948 RepID=A0AA35YCB0_LACSI|nr:unnamed protein product [Lactuca saligna]